MALMDTVFELEGKTEEERKEILLKILEEKGYEYDLEKFNFKGNEGTNIIIEMGSGEKEILLISHYDTFQNSPGANDNASAIAVSLDVFRRLTEYKKKGLLNGKVKVIFFGKEEPVMGNPKGRAGSRSYVQTNKDDLRKTSAVINLELCGSGDMIGIWPVTNENKDSKILDIIKKVFDKIQIYYETAGKLPGFWADYESFREQGFFDAFCLTAVKKEDKDDLRLYVESFPIEIAMRNALGFFFKKFKPKMPELLMHYHNSEDKSSYLSESALRMMSDATFNLLVNLDRKLGKGIEEF